MASVDMSRPSFDRAHEHTTFYLPAENLSQPFSSFSSGRLDTTRNQDAQQTSHYQSQPRDAPTSAWRMRESKDRVVAAQPGSSSLTTSLRESRTAKQGIDGNTGGRRPLDLDLRPSQTGAGDESTFSGEVSDLEDYQDPASSSSFASPSYSSDTSDFADCDSEGATWWCAPGYLRCKAYLQPMFCRDICRF